MAKITYAPLESRLKRLARDSANAINTLLGLFVGIRQTVKTSDEFDRELLATIEQVTAMAETWYKLRAELDILRAKMGETNEQEFISLVEQAADSAMLAGNIGQLYNISEIETSQHMLRIYPELIPIVVKEVLTHEGGRERLELFRDEINGALKDE